MRIEIKQVAEALSAVQEGLLVDSPQRERLLSAAEMLSKRAVLLVGPRGTGKTTFALNYLKQLPDRYFYVSLDNPLMAGSSLLELGDWVFKNGYDVLICDEVDCNPHAAGDLKALYDKYAHQKIWALGNLGTGFSKDFWVQECSYLSFREFIWLKRGVVLPQVSYEDLVSKDLRPICAEINQYFWAQGRYVQEEFQNYLKSGMKPFLSESDYILPSHQMRHVMGYLALSEDPEISIEFLFKAWGVSKLTVYQILDTMQKTGLVNIVRHEDSHKEHSKGAKVFFADPSLYGRLGGILSHVRESFFVMQLRQIGKNPVCPKDDKKYDYKIDSQTFEFYQEGQQAKKADFVLRQDIDTPAKREIPLWLLGVFEACSNQKRWKLRS